MKFREWLKEKNNIKVGDKLKHGSDEIEIVNIDDKYGYVEYKIKDSNSTLKIKKDVLLKQIK